MNPVITIARRFEFDMGHRVTHHRSKCRHLHGHRYSVLFFLTGELIDDPGAGDHGMVMDYGDVKERLAALIDGLDHGFMIWSEDPLCTTLQATGTKIIVVPFVPTAEHIARHLLERSRAILGELVVSVTVYETPNCSAEAVWSN